MRRFGAIFGVSAVLMAGAIFLPSASPAASGGMSGAQIYGRCAACHTANGAGVPGTFPPFRADFRALAANPGGRRYLQLALIKGVSGPIKVDGRDYRGMMPAQSLDDAGIAAVLNHVGTTIAKTGPAFKSFTAAEVKATRAGAGALNSAAVAKLRPSGGK